MFKNYFKIALRNLNRQRTYSFINITGLALGLACSMLIMLWVQDELSFDKFNENADSIYRVLVQYPEGDNNKLVETPHAPSPLAQAAKDEIPEVIEAVRMEVWGNKKELIKYNDKVFYETAIASCDPLFFKMFSFPIIKGRIPAEKNDIVITEDLAHKYFGDENPIGKVLNWNNWQLFKVTGVISNIPHNSHIQFNILTNYDNEEKAWPYGFSWSMFNRPIYLQLQKNANVQEVNRKLTELLKKYNPKVNNPLIKVMLQPLTDIHLTAGLVNDRAEVKDKKYIYIYSFIALFILLIACINFINLSTARSINRAREIGLRKTIGASRSQVFTQYITESFLMVCISQLIAIALVELFLPTFNALAGKKLIFDILNINVVAEVVAIILLASLLAGSYPALYLSRFNPIRVLKGSVKAGTNSAALRKSLIITQFSLSIILVLSTILVAQQLHYLTNKKLGFVKENIVYVPVKDNIGKKYDLFKEHLLKNPNILSLASKDILPTESFAQTRIAKQGQNTEKGVNIERVGVGYDYFKTLDLTLTQGRAFSKEYSTDATDAIIVNEEAVRQLELSSPIGKKIYVGKRGYTIIGVLKDALFRSLYNKIEPQVYFKLSDLTNNGINLYGVILIKINGKNEQSALASIKEAWDEINPTYPLEIHFLNERYNQLYGSEKQTSTIINYFTLLAILISCLGLFGLVSFTAEQRAKEIGVRKVLGATVSDIVMMLSKSFIKWVIIANIIAWPVAWFLMNNWLKDFAYHINISWWIFLIAGISTLLIALLTVSIQTVRAATANPVKTLRYE